MPDIIDWTGGERDQFSHKLEELIHGPTPTRKIGFVLTVFPITEHGSRATVLANVPSITVANVLYPILRGIMEKKDG